MSQNCIFRISIHDKLKKSSLPRGDGHSKNLLPDAFDIDHKSEVVFLDCVGTQVHLHFALTLWRQFAF